MKYDLTPVIIKDPPKNLNKLIRQLEKKLRGELKKLKYQSAGDTITQLCDAYLHAKDYSNQLNMLCQKVYLYSHGIIDLDGSTGFTVKNMQEWGMLPLAGIEAVNTPGDLYQFNGLKELLNIDNYDIREIFVEVNKQYSNSGYFSLSPLILWGKLEEAIDAYDRKMPND